MNEIYLQIVKGTEVVERIRIDDEELLNKIINYEIELYSKKEEAK